MKKLHPILILLLVLALLTGCAVSAATLSEEKSIAELTDIPTAAAPPVTEAPLPTQPEKLTAHEAQAMALADAGLTAEGVTGLLVKYEVDDGVPLYEVDFRSGDYEYEYEIHAGTGRIFSRSKEYDPVPTAPPATEPVKPAPTDPAVTVPAPTESPRTAAQPEKITADRAVSIALARVGLAKSDVTRLKVAYEVDDGVPQYEVEFRHGRTEYDFEIHGVSGKILDFDKDIDD